jgi:hypothetical protein
MPLFSMDLMKVFVSSNFKLLYSYFTFLSNWIKLGNLKLLIYLRLLKLLILLLRAISIRNLLSIWNLLLQLLMINTIIFKLIIFTCNYKVITAKSIATSYFIRFILNIKASLDIMQFPVHMELILNLISTMNN